jgi:DNA repair exonuclease SbcCD ATPase subunit
MATAIFPNNLNPAQLGNLVSGAGGVVGQTAAQATQKLSDAKAKIDKAKGITDKAKKELEKAKNARNFLKEQTKLSPADLKNILAAAVLPILSKFINTEKIVNAVINKIIDEAKKKLSKYGKVEVIGGTIYFTPRNVNSDFTKYVTSIKQKLDTIKKTIAELKKIVDSLITILKVIKAGLVAIKLYIIVLKVQSKKLAAAAVAESLLPTPNKPAASAYLAFKETTEPLIKELEKKVDDYMLMATAVSSILNVFKRLIDKSKQKLDNFNIVIILPPTPNSSIYPTEVISGLSTPSENKDSIEIYEDMNGKEYIIRVVNLSNGTLQAIAYDRFSNLPITKTAPSRIREADELIDELKQILG